MSLQLLGISARQFGELDESREKRRYGRMLCLWRSAVLPNIRIAFAAASTTLLFSANKGQPKAKTKRCSTLDARTIRRKLDIDTYIQ